MDSGEAVSIDQKIAMKKVNLTAQLSRVLGRYGQAEETIFYQSVYDNEPQEFDLSFIGNLGTANIYIGYLLKYDQVKQYRYIAYSFIDLLSASGGLLSSMYYGAIPVALLFSRFQYETGVMSLLFTAKSSKYDYFRKLKKDKSHSFETIHEQKTRNHNRVHLSTK